MHPSAIPLQENMVSSNSRIVEKQPQGDFSVAIDLVKTAAMGYNTGCMQTGGSGVRLPHPADKLDFFTTLLGGRLLLERSSQKAFIFFVSDESHIPEAAKAHVFQSSAVIILVAATGDRADCPSRESACALSCHHCHHL
jgi:hypothetical protein